MDFTQTSTDFPKPITNLTQNPMDFTEIYYGFQSKFNRFFLAKILQKQLISSAICNSQEPGWSDFFMQT